MAKKKSSGASSAPSLRSVPDTSDLPDDRLPTVADIDFESDLVKWHSHLDATEPALLINPAAEHRDLVGAAQARMQAIHGSLEAWAGAEDLPEGISLPLILYPLDHLAQEVQLLLEALQIKLREKDDA